MKKALFPVRAFIQARMRSSRFPGKVLAPFRGRPLIDHVIERVAQAVDPAAITVAVSTEPADDPLAAYLQSSGVAIFRGPEEDVLSRFQLCLEKYPCAWFFRVCADSPLLDARLLQAAARARRADLDLVTNIFPRTFPRGQSVELLQSARFAAIAAKDLNCAQREHVTQVYYDQPESFRVLNLARAERAWSQEPMAVDTLEDLRRLEKFRAPRAAPPVRAPA